MTGLEFDTWASENGTTRERHTINTIDYVFVTLTDGWIAILEATRGEYTPIIQAADMAHALSYCAMREPVTVPLKAI